MIVPETLQFRPVAFKEFNVNVETNRKGQKYFKKAVLKQEITCFSWEYYLYHALNELS